MERVIDAINLDNEESKEKKTEDDHMETKHELNQIKLQQDKTRRLPGNMKNTRWRPINATWHLAADIFSEICQTDINYLSKDDDKLRTF